MLTMYSLSDGFAFDHDFSFASSKSNIHDIQDRCVHYQVIHTKHKCLNGGHGSTTTKQPSKYLNKYISNTNGQLNV